jgi:hypothetical protein
VFKEFQAKAKKQLGKYIDAIRFDQSGKYLFRDFKDHLLDAEIVSSN